MRTAPGGRKKEEKRHLANGKEIEEMVSKDEVGESERKARTSKRA